MSLSLVAGCKSSDAPRETNVPAAQAEGPAGQPAVAENVCVAPTTLSTGYMGPSAWPSTECRDRAAALVAEMTIEQKAAQMMQPDIDQLGSMAEVEQRGFGSILAGGNSGPKDPTPANWADAIDELHHAAAKAPHGIPILYGIDAVHGHNNVKGAVIFPHNIGLGATRDPALVERIARVTAEDVRATGMNWVFAPVLAAPQDERWGRTYEGYSESPELVAQMGVAVVRGLQGEALGQSPTSVLATAKHYIADGNTDLGVDQGDSSITDEEVRAQLLPAYQQSIEAGVGSVMASYSSIRGTKMHCNGPWVTDVLKKELGFNGFVVSDWEAVEKIPGNYPDRLADTVNAGVDMIMHPAAYNEFIPTLAGLVPEEVSTERIDDAVTRILAVKCEMGLLPRKGEQGRPPLAQRDKLTLLQAPQRRALAREAVRKSLVLLKNEGGVLPLAKKAKIHVGGKNADDLGHQLGGWSVSWQGGSGDTTDGTSILEGLREVAGPDADITFAVDGTNGRGADVGVVVVGETPYAEMEGDRKDLALAPEDVAAVQAMKKAGLPVVVVVVSGRPLLLDAVLQDVDAVVAAWLPGTEGAGVADVLFGDVKPTGKLSFTWPKSMAQIPINDSQGDRALYPFGFGLTYP